MKAGTTLRVRGEGGAEWDQDVPADGTTQRELLDDHIAKGRILVLEDPDGDEPGEPPVEVLSAEELRVMLDETLPEAVDAIEHGDYDRADEMLRHLVHVGVSATDVVVGFHDLCLGPAVNTHLTGPLMGGYQTETQPGDRPKVRDGKDVWVSYAISQGVDPDEAAATSKDDLIKRYGAKED
jgi:hypothetical protein